MIHPQDVKAGMAVNTKPREAFLTNPYGLNNISPDLTERFTELAANRSVGEGKICCDMPGFSGEIVIVEHSPGRPAIYGLDELAR